MKIYVTYRCSNCSAELIEETGDMPEEYKLCDVLFDRRLGQQRLVMRFSETHYSKDFPPSKAHNCTLDSFGIAYPACVKVVENEDKQ